MHNSMDFALWISFAKVGDSELYSLKTGLPGKDFDLLRNSRPSAYIGTVGRELRSKSKSFPGKPVFRL